jgi:hypothetical protein
MQKSTSEQSENRANMRWIHFEFNMSRYSEFEFCFNCDLAFITTMSNRTPRARTPRAASPAAETRRRSSSTAKTTPLTPRANGKASRRKSVQKTGTESNELKSSTAPDTHNSLNTADGNGKALPATPKPIVVPKPPTMSKCKKCVFGGIVALTAAQLAFVCLNASKLSYAAKLSHLAIIFVTMCSLIAMLPPLAQSLSYHNFADQRSLCCGIPNTFDVTVRPFRLLYRLAHLCPTSHLLYCFVSPISHFYCLVQWA